MGKTKCFPDTSTYKYLNRVSEPVRFQPQFVEILETRSNIWKEYAATFIRFIAMYPKLSFVFITNNKPFEVKAFFKLFPALAPAFNVIGYASDMFQVLETKQYPYCVVVSPSNRIIYQGSPMSTFKLQPHLHMMNLIAQQISTKVEEPAPRQHDSISAQKMSMALSGLSNDAYARSEEDLCAYGTVMAGGQIIRKNSIFMPPLNSRPRSANFQRQRSYPDVALDIFETSAPLVEKLGNQGQKSPIYITQNALRDTSQRDQFAEFVRQRRFGPTVDQIRNSEEGINPRMRRQRLIGEAVDEHDALAVGRRDLRNLQKKTLQLRIKM